MPAKSIDEIVLELTEIVDWARNNKSRIGYFAAMYRKVTVAVQQAIETGEFEDAERMTRLDVVFAQRYIDATADFMSGKAPTASWQVAFDGAGRWRPIIIQHLLTGMSAHINLDLGIAAATVAPGAELAALEADFNTINTVLGRLVDGFTADIAEVSPWIRLLDRIGGRADDALINFSIGVARIEAWDLAGQLAPLSHPEWETVITARDEWTAGFGDLLLHPGWVFTGGLLAIRIRESNDIVRVIDVLSN
ncbi:MAG: DUF5995 family protein [Acidimicrobiia bacterium]|nr:MAG: DUF5995 family protein [Acidimicrobiia bacterium]